MNTWYHGTKNDFDAFSLEWLGKGNDEVGSGFYFTDSIDTARRYAGAEGRVIEAHLDIRNPLLIDSAIQREHIGILIINSPDFDDAIQNYGEVASEGFSKVVGRAISSYEGMQDGPFGALDCLNSLSNDFWSGHEAHFLERLHELTSFDGLYRDFARERHAVVWDPAQIRILGIVPAIELTNDLPPTPM